MSPNQSKCKSCQADILWVITPKGERTPVDAKKTRVATLMDMGGTLKIEEVHEGHVTHWATCVSADQHRKKPDPQGNLPGVGEPDRSYSDD